MFRGFTSVLFVFITLLSFASDYDFVLNAHLECKKFYRQNDFESANALAKELLTLDHDSDSLLSETFYILGITSRKMNHFAESIQYYEQAIDKSKDDNKKAKIYNNIIGVLLHMNLPGMAIKEAEKAESISQIWRPVTLYNKSLAYLSKQDYAAAEETLEAALVQCTANENEFYKARIYNQIGLLQLALYEISEESIHAKRAAQNFDYASDIKANKVEVGKALNYQANLKRLLGDSTAHTAYQAAVHGQPDNYYRFDALRDFSDYLLANDHIGEATMMIDSALALFPQVPLTGETLMIFFHAQQVGYETPQFQDQFTQYVDQRRKTEQAYAAYIGRQLQKERALKIRERNQLILLGISLLVMITLGVRIYRRKMKDRSAMRDLKELFRT